MNLLNKDFINGQHEIFHGLRVKDKRELTGKIGFPELSKSNYVDVFLDDLDYGVFPYKFNTEDLYFIEDTAPIQEIEK